MLDFPICYSITGIVLLAICITTILIPVKTERGLTWKYRAIIFSYFMSFVILLMLAVLTV